MKGRLPYTKRQAETRQALASLLSNESSVSMNLDSLYDLVTDVADTLCIGHIEAELRIGELQMAIWTIQVVENPCSWN